MTSTALTGISDWADTELSDEAFDIRDGTLLHGPAAGGQPALQCRDLGDRIEVRRREPQ